MPFTRSTHSGDVAAHALVERVGGKPAYPTVYRRPGQSASSSYFPPHTFIISSDPCILIPLSDRIASVASSIAFRGNTMLSP